MFVACLLFGGYFVVLGGLRWLWVCWYLGLFGKLWVCLGLGLLFGCLVVGVVFVGFGWWWVVA